MKEQYACLAQWYDAINGHDEKLWGEYICRLLQQCGVRPGARVVDAACGTGEISLPLSRAGYDVTGVDISLPMLTRAAEKAAEAGLPVHFLHADMTQFRLPRNVRAVTCACDGVNYVLDEEALSTFFANVRKGLPQGGVLLFDISSACKLTHMDGQLYGEDDEDLAYLWYNKLENGILTMDLTFFIKQANGLYRREAETHRQRVWQAEELRTLLAQAGFDCRIYGAFTLEPPAENCDRLQFVAIAQ